MVFYFLNLYQTDNKMIFLGTIVNAVLIIAGTLIGVFFGRFINEKVKNLLFTALGLVTFILGIQMALEFKNIIIIALSVALGAITGEIIDIDCFFTKAVDRLKVVLRVGENGNFTQGFITASLIYCVGSMAIIGSIDSGVRNNHTVLITKSLLDGFMSVILSSTFGFSVALSAVPIIIYQGTITLLASVAENFFTPFIIAQLTSTGGILVAGLGITLIKIREIKILNLTPALVYAIIFSYISVFLKIS